MPPRPSKLQRWTDLIAALLRRRYPATFEELAPDVPAYAKAAAGDLSKRERDALMRMFERDKDELRSFGIMIETVSFDDGEAQGYKLDRKGFYLPYLSLVSEGKPKSMPRKPGKFGYHALATLVFEPDDLSIITAAAARVMALGDPVLREEAESALRKLAFDLPVPDVVGEEQPLPAYAAMDSTVMGMRVAVMRAPENVFEMLNEALVRRKSVAFDYHSMGSDRTARRNVEPYGLFFLSAHWYVAARDIHKSELRNFRLNRIRNVELNRMRAQSADYVIPDDFNLREHARSRHAWELGDNAGEHAIVDFRNPTGAAKAAARLGIAVEGASDRRKFQIRRVDSFARWLLSFGGEAVPIAPPALVNEFERQIRETSAVYGATDA